MPSGPIYLIGPSAHPNFGDEFIAAAWLRYLATARPDSEVWLDCPNPGLAQILFKNLHPRVRFTDTVWRLTFDHAELSGPDADAAIRERVTHLGTPTYDLGLLTLREAESIHLIGGGYINDNWRHHAGVIHAMQAVRALTGARLLATGQGLLPVMTEGIPAKELFDGFDHVSARDDGGAEAYGVRFGLDDAFLGVSDAISAGGESDALYICIQSDTVEPSRIASAVGIARREAVQAKADGRDVFYLEAVPGGDRAAFEQLADLIPEENFLPFASIWTQGLPLSPHQTWVTSRFHFHLLGATAGGRGIAVAMMPGYYDVKHESVVALGSGWALATDDELPAMPVAAGALATKVSDLVAQKAAEAQSLYPPAAAAPASPEPPSLRNQLGETLRRRLVR